MLCKAIVRQINANNCAQVEIKCADLCATCGLCAKLSSFSKENKNVSAINNIGARVGDVVEINIPDSQILKSSLILFLLPVGAFFAGYFVGAMVSKGWGLIMALLFLAFSFILIKLYDNSFKSRIIIIRRG